MQIVANDRRLNVGKVINVVVDASGSMMEDDKNAVVKYLINGICNIRQSSEYKDVEFVLFQWGNNSIKFDNIVKAKIEFKGKTSYDDFRAIEGEIDSNCPMILISDGGFSKSDKNQMEKLSKHIIPIFVGADANRAILKDIATDKIVYSVTDFMQALEEAKM